MPTFLQAVILPEWCFLYEALYWVAFQRLPIASYTLDAGEYRLSDEVEDYEAEITDSPQLISEDETKFAGIPRDPEWVAWAEERSLLPASEYEKVLAGSARDASESYRRQMMDARDAALQLEKECKEWDSCSILESYRDGFRGQRGEERNGALLSYYASNQRADFGFSGRKRRSSRCGTCGR
jgi:hypothetical protein